MYFMKNEGDIRLSIKQARRVFILEQLSAGKMTNMEASSLLDLSLRQAQRKHRSEAAELFSSGNTGPRGRTGQITLGRNQCTAYVGAAL